MNSSGKDAALRGPHRFEGPAVIPYQTESVPNASGLLVCFPKLAPGGAPPAISQRRRLGDLPVHRLYLGADRNTFVGPRATMAGARTAVELIHHESDRLGVPLADVTCAGTSMGAVCALAVGMMAGVRRIVSGGPPVRMGSQLKAFRTIDGPNNEAKAAAKEFLALADGGDQSPAAFLDGLIYRAAEGVRGPTDIVLFASRTDRTWPEAARLHDALAEHPLISCELREGAYGAHREIAQPFFQCLAGIVMTRSAPADV